MTETKATEPGSAEHNGAGQAVARRDTTPLTQRDPMGLAQHFANSGFFSDARDVSKAVVKIAAGEELGLSPMASMQGIHIIEGKPSLSANLLATLVKRSEKYDYKVIESGEQKCRLEFFEDGKSVGFAEFTLERAQKMQTKQHGKWIPLADTLRWKNSPEDMLFARTMSRGVRKFAPDVTAGSPAYVPEELGAEVDAAGEPVYIESEAVEETPTPALDVERVHDLVDLIEEAEDELAKGGVNAHDGLNVLLGSIGIDGFSPNEKLEDELAKLTPEQGDALKAELHKLIDAAPEGGEPDAE